MWELPKVSSPQRLTVEIGPSCANSSWRGVEELFAHEGPTGRFRCPVVLAAVEDWIKYDQRARQHGQ